ncbi:MAG: 30S ribosomal protein S17 [Acidobacteria bacterium]|nr:30S ribosomal protein S17 [Acidobacteriota bacterium]
MADKPVAARHRSLEVGQVVSRAGNKTIVVEVARHGPHPMYERYMHRRKKFHVHDEKNECQLGDWIRFAECRPLSRHKRWRLREIITRAAVPVLAESDAAAS